MFIVNATPVEPSDPKFSRGQIVSIIGGVFSGNAGKIVKIEHDMNGSPAYRVDVPNGVGIVVLNQTELEAR